MVTKIKEKCLLVDYQQNFFQQVQNLKQRETYVREYTKEFFRMSLRESLKEPEFQ
jgi:hypothetical protein